MMGCSTSVMHKYGEENYEVSDNGCKNISGEAGQQNHVGVFPSVGCTSLHYTRPLLGTSTTSFECDNKHHLGVTVRQQ